MDFIKVLNCYKKLEQYAWAIISAVGILFVGGGLPFYSGISNLVMDQATTLTWEHMKVACKIFIYIKMLY